MTQDRSDDRSRRRVPGVDGGGGADAGAGARAGVRRIVPLPPDLVRREAARRAAVRAAGVTHPGLVPLVDVRQVPEGLALVHAEPPGARPLLLAGPVPDRAAAALAPVAAAIAALHAAGLAHGRVDASTVLLHDGGGLLTGVGLAAAADGPLDPDADVAALGALLDEVLPPRSCPAGLGQLLVRAADPDPEVRPAAADVAAELERTAREQAARDQAVRDQAVRDQAARDQAAGGQDAPAPATAIPAARAPDPIGDTAPQSAPDVVGQVLTDAVRTEWAGDAGWVTAPGAGDRPSAPRLTGAGSPPARRRGVVGPDLAPGNAPRPDPVPLARPGRPGHAAVSRAERRSGRGRVAVPLLIAAGVLLGVVGLRAVGRDLGPPAASAPTAVALLPVPVASAASSVPSAAPVAPAPVQATPVASTPVASTPVAPPADWQPVLEQLDLARDRAFAAADARALAEADAPGSPALARDRKAVDDLAARGLRVEGLEVTVVSTRLVADRGDEVELSVRDRRSSYMLVDAVGTVLAERPAAGERNWRVTLQRTDAGWRTAQVLPG